MGFTLLRPPALHNNWTAAQKGPETLNQAVVTNLHTPAFRELTVKTRVADLNLQTQSHTPPLNWVTFGLLPFLGEKNKLKPKGDYTGLGSHSSVCRSDN